jgi:NAD/NADP transhydrogenase beta subunit
MPRRPGSPPQPGAAWAVAAAWLAVAAGLGLPLAASAPPLLVLGFEWINGRGRRDAREGIRLTAVLIVTWTIGAVLAAHAPPAAAGACTLLAVAALIRVTGVTHAPVLAIGLVPLVLGAPATPGGVAAGACGIALAAAFLFLSGSLVRMSPGATWLRRIIASATTRSQP